MKRENIRSGGGVKVLIYATNQCLPRHKFKEKPIHSITHNFNLDLYSANMYQRANLEKQHQRLIHSTSCSHLTTGAPPCRGVVLELTLKQDVHSTKKPNIKKVCSFFFGRKPSFMNVGLMTYCFRVSKVTFLACLLSLPE